MPVVVVVPVAAAVRAPALEAEVPLVAQAVLRHTSFLRLAHVFDQHLKLVSKLLQQAQLRVDLRLRRLLLF